MNAPLMLERQGGGFPPTGTVRLLPNDTMDEIARRYNAHTVLVDTLRDVMDNGLIYWEPATTRGMRCKAAMMARLSALLAEQGGAA